MPTSCHTQTCLWPSRMAAVRRTAWSGLWSITSPPFTRAERVQLPRSPTTPSSERPSTAPGRCPGPERPPRSPPKEALIQLPPKTPTKCALWQSRCHTTPLFLASMLNAKRGGCVSTRMCGPRASSWECRSACP